mmetsp:Transcript_24050/g.37089  ORF Transcript_24050/g.37089 Transcript_24050/m.37089 type:complete len:179 (-) Transcript_24050:126-662(-)|eukprot:CAMPEP_0196802102 /NCGR_PEP_ID=MMETSP1362-20130617/1803_1 /TAXON_ID=163516 /ORGANISM="Leptocylindrus danicus, Strain CCMP1856" /LENGTH=178 /DNA_ID=CAMNT_0042173315 /DNA_START=230 /DNA_END=766 /DNA_ORIENTATION=-
MTLVGLNNKLGAQLAELSEAMTDSLAEFTRSPRTFSKTLSMQASLISTHSSWLLRKQIPSTSKQGDVGTPSEYARNILAALYWEYANLLRDQVRRSNKFLINSFIERQAEEYEELAQCLFQSRFDTAASIASILSETYMRLATLAQDQVDEFYMANEFAASRICESYAHKLYSVGIEL